MDPIHDLAGYLNPLHGALYVLAGHEQAVLSALGAEPAAEGWYQMQALTVDGNLEPLRFQVVVGNPAVTVEDPELIMETSDYKVYKNAQCVQVAGANAVGCGPYPGTDDHATVEYRSVRKCRRGTEYCIEVKQVYWIRYVYDDAACTVLKDIDTGKGYMCP